ncbi:MAG: DUF1684 domain-containing protein [Sediminibacterium sp.]|nr:DUF1684 domain-containing protein [Sediminibacterium sp.]
MKKLLFVLIILAMGLGADAQTGTYAAEIEQWVKGRYAALKNTKSGWLNLAGLYWLEEGKNSFGTAAGNKIVFPKGTIAAKAGYFELNNGKVTLVPEKGVAIQVNGRPITRELIYSKDSLRSAVSSYGSLHWTIIRREDRIGIRLRNDLNESLLHFKSIDRYPADTAWKLEAVLKEPLFPTSIPIKNVLGQTIQMKLLGKLIFTIQGKVFSLDAVGEGDDELFVIFGDATNTHTTYGAGRFMYVPKPDASGKTILDFNKAFNPPCAFTPFATCPLPPQQNVLPVAVTAGEKDYGKH